MVVQREVFENAESLLAGAEGGEVVRAIRIGLPKYVAKGFNAVRGEEDKGVIGGERAEFLEGTYFEGRRVHG